MTPLRIPPPLDNTEQHNSLGDLIRPAIVVRCFRCGISVVPGAGIQVQHGPLTPIVHAVCP